MICSPQCLRCLVNIEFSEIQSCKTILNLKNKPQNLKTCPEADKKALQAAQNWGEMIAFFVPVRRREATREEAAAPKKECDIKAAADCAAACEYFCKELSLLVICYGESK